ncbi:MAG TPA: DMT family transporter [Hyphomicrobiaceae bacterium]|jgi:drug/metabolite transporter (DMT)-like permease
MRVATNTLSASPSAEPLQSRRLPLPVLIAAFCLLWASAFSVAKMALADCPPLLVLAARFVLAGALILGGAAVYGVPFKMSRRDVLVFAVLGIANQAVYLGLGLMGMRSISSGLAALIISANPVLTAVLAAVFLGDRMTLRKALGLLLGVGGVTFVVESRLAGGIEDLAGVGFALAALVSLVGGTILYKKLAPTGSLWLGNGVQSLAAGLATLPFAFTLESVADVVPSWRLVASLAYLALFVSVFAYLIWFELLDVAGATAASSYHFLMPPLGMLFGWLLLGEHVAPADLIGVVPVAAGIYLVTRPGPSQKKK